MKIFIGSDHAGFELKEKLVPFLKDLGYEVYDKGTHGPESVNYPNYAHAVAEAVSANETSLGVLICGSANGVCMTANKHQKIRAAIAWQVDIAELAKQHNNANILCLPARYLSTDEAKHILQAYLEAEFEGGRHQTRIDLI